MNKWYCIGTTSEQKGIIYVLEFQTIFISNLTGLEFTVSGTKIQRYVYKNHQALARIYIRAFNMRGPCKLDIGQKNITF